MLVYLFTEIAHDLIVAGIGRAEDPGTTCQQESILFIDEGDIADGCSDAGVPGRPALTSIPRGTYDSSLADNPSPFPVNEMDRIQVTAGPF